MAHSFCVVIVVSGVVIDWVMVLCRDRVSCVLVIDCHTVVFSGMSCWLDMVLDWSRVMHNRCRVLNFMGDHLVLDDSVGVMVLRFMHILVDSSRMDIVMGVSVHWVINMTNVSLDDVGIGEGRRNMDVSMGLVLAVMVRVGVLILRRYNYVLPISMLVDRLMMTDVLIVLVIRLLVRLVDLMARADHNWSSERTSVRVRLWTINYFVD